MHSPEGTIPPYVKDYILTTILTTQDHIASMHEMSILELKSILGAYETKYIPEAVRISLSASKLNITARNVLTATLNRRISSGEPLTKKVFDGSKL